jgi:hypothetical protein
MKTEFSPIHVTTIDFFAALIPGMLWLVVMSILLESLGIVRWVFDGTTNFLLIGQYHPIPIKGSQAGLLVSTVFLVLSFVIGDVVKTFCTKPAEFITALHIHIPIIVCRIFKKPYKKYSEYRFPYPAIHSTKPYYSQIQNLVGSLCPPIKESELPRSQPFSTCKRLLRLYVPTLWEDVERLEASTRMVASIFDASIFGVFTALIMIFRDKYHTIDGMTLLLIFLLSTILLSIVYWRRRHSEVDYVYLNTIVSFSLLKRGINWQPNQEKSSN